MPKISDGRIALVALIALAAWLLIGLPLLYLPSEGKSLWQWLAHDAAGFFTAVLVVVGAVQLVFFIWQLRLIRTSLTATQNAVDLARQEFIATHRPRVVVRYIQGPFRNEDGYRFIWITIVNTGINDAVIEQFGADLALRRDEDDEWETPGLDADPKTIEPIVLTCGQRHVFTATAKSSDATDQAIFRDTWDDHQLCAVGVVRYKDGNGVARHTGFFRVLADDGERFVLSPHDAEMEYQD
jgi:hypothetical protein